MDISGYIPFYDGLERQEKELLESGVLQRTFNAGERVHNGGADCSGLVFVREGQLRAYIVSQSEKELTIYRLTGGDVCLFSASCVLKDIDFEIFIDAEKTSDCLVLPPDVFEKLAKNRAAERFVGSLMSLRFSEVMWLIEHTLFKSFDSRLAAFLIEQSAIENSLYITLTHEEIARHLGSAREVVSRMLKHFQGEGYARAERGRIEITNLNALLTLSK